MQEPEEVTGEEDEWELSHSRGDVAPDEQDVDQGPRENKNKDQDDSSASGRGEAQDT